jgi:hypothetical protein
MSNDAYPEGVEPEDFEGSDICENCNEEFAPDDTKDCGYCNARLCFECFYEHTCSAKDEALKDAADDRRLQEWKDGERPNGAGRYRGENKDEVTAVMQVLNELFKPEISPTLDDGEKTK